MLLEMELPASSFTPSWTHRQQKPANVAFDFTWHEIFVENFFAVIGAWARIWVAKSVFVMNWPHHMLPGEA
jgi:hypothetical protein